MQQALKVQTVASGRKQPAPFEALRFTDSLPAAKAGCWVWHLETDLFIADAEMQSLLGIQLTVPSLRLEGFSKYICLKDQLEVGRLLRRCWQEGRQLDESFSVIYPGCEARKLRWHGGRLRQPKYPVSTLGGIAVPAASMTLEAGGPIVSQRIYSGRPDSRWAQNKTRGLHLARQEDCYLQ